MLSGSVKLLDASGWIELLDAVDYGGPQRSFCGLVSRRVRLGWRSLPSTTNPILGVLGRCSRRFASGRGYCCAWCILMRFHPIGGGPKTTKMDKKHGSRQESHPLLDRPGV